MKKATIWFPSSANSINSIPCLYTIFATTKNFHELTLMTVARKGGECDSNAFMWMYMDTLLLKCALIMDAPKIPINNRAIIFVITKRKS